MATKTRHAKTASQDKTADAFRELTERVIAEMETNPTNWSKPWVDAWSTGGLPTNVETRQSYTGGNVLAFTVAAMLKGYEGPAWATYNQWKALGGQVRKGEKGTTGIRPSVKVYKDETKRDADGKPVERRMMYFVGFSVFHADQVDNGREIAEARLGAGVKFEHDPLDEAERLIAASGAVIRSADSAFYSPGGDFIGMPDRCRFPDLTRYYTTALHELTHWTGHKTRTGRHPEKFAPFGSEEYAREELVAELGAVMLGAGHLGLSVELREDHAAYLASWIKVLKKDSRAIWSAAGQAEKAARYILNMAGVADGSEDGKEVAELVAA